MHIQNLVKFYQFVLKILSGNQIMTDRMMKGRSYKLKDSGLVLSVLEKVAKKV